MALTQISTQGIKDGTITGADLATNVDLVDDQKIRFGNSQDLQIYVASSNNQNYIDAIADGITNIRADILVLARLNSDKFAKFTAGGSSELYFAGNKKFETTSTGATVTGTISAGGAILSGNQSIASDSAKLFFGASNDLEIYHNGSHSYIDDAGTGNLYIRSSQLVLQNAAGDEDLAILTSNGAVKLYFNDSKKFETTSGGVQVTDNLNMSGGHIFLADNYKLNVGTGDDLQIYHDGSDSYINDTGTGDLNIRGSIVRAQASNGDTLFRGVEDGAVELYYDNSKKFETFANGIKLYDTQGDLIGEGFDGGFNFTSSVMVNELRLQDNEKIKVGLGEDLQIYHLSSGGGDSYITNSNGNLNIVNSTDGWIRLQPKSGEEGVIVKYDGAVELYHDNSKKFETLAGGVQWTGSIKNPTDGTDQGIYFGVDSDFQISHDGSSNHIKGTGNHFTRFWTGNTNRWNITNDGHFRPEANNAYDIGASNQRVRNIYTNDLNLSNEGSANDVDGTWGSYTIQEGAEDLFLINKRNGKKYRFNLTEVS